ncbi:hypothetical protein [Pseudoroseicyclus sp. CXY001]|uniref:hypothetical protein n=1 Tax=Pseudoroseicyclus sp. CXY001 TaxID=3242492 RepID=UPI00358DD08D
MHLLLRMSMLARRQPAARTVVVVLAVIVLCGALYAVDRIWGWPDWLTPNGPRGRMFRG